MKALGWLLALSLLAVLLAAVLRYSPGYVLVVVPPYRVELSVGLALTVIAGAFALGYLLLRAGSLGSSYRRSGCLRPLPLQLASQRLQARKRR